MEILKFIQSFSNPLLDTLAQGITMFGEQYFYILSLTIVFWCLNKKFGYKLGFAMLFSFVINGAIKDIFVSPRPIGKPGIRSLRVGTATGHSFPSGHTQTTSTFWTSLMVRFKKCWLYILGTIIILSVAISRLYLGVHWPKDVIGGIIFGAISVFIANYLFDYAENNNNRYVLLLMIIPSIIGLLFFKSDDYAKAVGLSSSFYIGYIIETKYINFNTKSTLLKQTLKVIFGLTILLIIEVGLKKLLPETRLYDLFRYFVIGLWTSVGAPFTFKKCKL